MFSPFPSPFSSCTNSDWENSNRKILPDNEERAADIHSVSCTIPGSELLGGQVFLVRGLSQNGSSGRRMLLVHHQRQNNLIAHFWIWLCSVRYLCSGHFPCEQRIFGLKKKTKNTTLRNRKCSSRMITGRSCSLQFLCVKSVAKK